MARYFEAPDAHDEPTIWEETADPRWPLAVMRRCDLRLIAHREEFWPLIVAALTKPCTCPTDSEIDAAIEAATANLTTRGTK